MAGMSPQKRYGGLFSNLNLGDPALSKPLLSEEDSEENISEAQLRVEPPAARTIRSCYEKKLKKRPSQQVFTDEEIQQWEALTPEEKENIFNRTIAAARKGDTQLIKTGKIIQIPPSEINWFENNMNPRQGLPRCDLTQQNIFACRHIIWFQYLSAESRQWVIRVCEKESFFAMRFLDQIIEPHKLEPFINLKIRGREFCHHLQSQHFFSGPPLILRFYKSLIKAALAKKIKPEPVAREPAISLRS